jgi:hypothetical protein
VQFWYLQVLDFLSTVAFLLYGVQEANPIVRWFLEISSSPLQGLLIVKVVAIALGILVWHKGKLRLLARINLLFAVVVTWNLVALIIGAITMI